ncbi:MAG TPA: hypothetical protein DD417_03000 [Elusimicrobia bacterium]|nr:hypothetical protein [Elusimicrobiota bacterium]
MAPPFWTRPSGPQAGALGLFSQKLGWRGPMKFRQPSRGLFSQLPQAGVPLAGAGSTAEAGTARVPRARTAKGRRNAFMALSEFVIV